MDKMLIFFTPTNQLGSGYLEGNKFFEFDTCVGHNGLKSEVWKVRKGKRKKQHF